MRGTERGSVPFEKFRWSGRKLELRNGDTKPLLREIDARNFSCSRAFAIA